MYRCGYTTGIEFRTPRGLNRNAGHMASQKKKRVAGGLKIAEEYAESDI